MGLIKMNQKNSTLRRVIRKSALSGLVGAPGDFDAIFMGGGIDMEYWPGEEITVEFD